MIKILFSLILFATILVAQNNPKLYSMLGDKLFNISSQFESLRYDSIIVDKVKSYKNSMKKV